MNRGQLVALAVALLAAVGLFGAARSRADSEVALVTATDETPTAAPDTASAPDAASTPDTAATEAPLAEAPENLGPAGTLRDLDGWLQTDATSLEDFDGQVRIVQFWTFSCFNCKATLSHLGEIYDTYRGDGLEIIGVHAPEFDFEKDQAAIAEAAIDLGVTWPIAIDTRKTNFRDWQPGRRFWPRTFVLDANGDIRFDHIGEGKYEELEATVAFLLANGGT